MSGYSLPWQIDHACYIFYEVSVSRAKLCPDRRYSNRLRENPAGRNRLGFQGST